MPSAMLKAIEKHQQLLIWLLVAILALTSGFFGWQYKTTNEALEAKNQEFNAYQTASENKIAERDNTIADLSDRLNLTSEELNDTRNNLQGERDRNDAMEEQITEIAGTVSDLDKLSKTDEELLQKYSKVYFLNEHYMPEDLDEIEKEYLYNEDRAQFLHGKVMPFFERMVEAALEDDINLWVVSAFRSFDRQTELKAAYSVTYGAGANAFSADQGFSEHQLGTTVDFTTNDLGGGLDGFGNTPAYEWLLDNAHKYGFVLSYPEGNAYYVYEPWHWRFVGEELADDLHDADQHFYDWDQREIDQYLLNIFD